jgi:hypothetical protein
MGGNIFMFSYGACGWIPQAKGYKFACFEFNPQYLLPGLYFE